MASKNIKGITIEIDGNTTGLDKALKGVNSTSVKLNSELGQVNKLLKFDPSNATGLAQKQELLTKSIENTSDKLNQLKSAQSQVDEQFKSGDIGEEQYRAFQRELASTEQSLKGYKSQLSNLQSEQQKLGQNTDRLNTYFSASGKSIDDFSGVLGTKLVNSIKNGTASSDQLELALNKIAKEALGAEGDVSKFKNALDKVDDGGSINSVKSSLEELKVTSNSTDEELSKIGGGITSGNMMQATQVVSDAGEKIKEFAGYAQDAFRDVDDGLDNYTTKTGKSSDKIKGAFDNIATSMPIDDLGELGNAIGEVDTQFGLTGNKLQSTSEYFLKFSEINKTDVSDSIQNTKDVLEQFNLTADKAPSVLDAITKTSQDTGTSVDDLFSIVKENSSTFESLGFDVGTSVNMIGKLDQQGVNAGAVIKALTKSQTTLASETAKSTKEVGDLEQKLQEQNKQLSNTKSGTPAYKSLSENINKTKVKLEEALTAQDKFSKGFGANLSDLQKSIKGATDEQDAINQASEVFGKKQAPQIAKAIRDGKLNLEEFGKAGKESLGTVGKTFDDTLDPIDRQKVAMQGVKIAMGEIGAAIAEGVQPILNSLIPMLKNIAKAFGELPNGIKTFIVIIGTLITAFTVLAPFIASIVTIFSSLAAAAAAAELGIGAFIATSLLPIIPIIAAVIAVIAVIILVIKNWGEIVSWLTEIWSGISPFFSSIFSFLGSIFSGFQPVLDTFVSFFQNTASNVMMIFNGIIGILQGVFDIVVGIFTLNGAKIGQGFAQVFQGLILIVSGVFSQIINFVTSSLSAIVNFFSGILGGIVGIVSGIFNSVKDAFTNPLETAKGVIKGIVDAIKGFFSFSITWPKIPMPHFSINPAGWEIGDLLKGKIPSLGVDWFANGGILTKPTIFGQNGNSLMVGGESGKEAVAPLSDLMAYVESAVANQIGDMSGNFAQMIQLLSIIANKELALDFPGSDLARISYKETEKLMLRSNV